MIDRAVIVTKPTRLDDLTERHMTAGAARFAVESQGLRFETYELEDATFRAALEATRLALPPDLPAAFVSRADLPNFLFREKDLVIVVGVDGLFANVAQYVGDQPVIGVNPDPASIAGNLVRFSPSQVGAAVAAVLAGRAYQEMLPFAKVSLSNRQVLWGINDIFLGRSDHVSARYRIDRGRDAEDQSSSGVIVSTGVGSTGWMRSVVAMVEGLTRTLSPGSRHSLMALPKPADQELVFAVREPFPSPSTGTSIVAGRVRPGSPLALVSQMASGGRIFSDGIVEKGLEWPFGVTATVTVGERHVRRVLPS